VLVRCNHLPIIDAILKEDQKLFLPMRRNWNNLKQPRGDAASYLLTFPMEHGEFSQVFHQRHNMTHQGRLCPIMLAIIILLSGCVKVGPDFIRPKVVVSPNWLEADDKRVKSESAEYRNWWQSLNDPVLDRMIDRAYRENLSLRIAGVRVLEARAQLGIAVGGFYPQTQEAFGSLEKIRQSARGPQVGPGVQLTYSQSEVGFQASWELDFWGKFRRAIESADASLLATVADYDDALVSLTADVANSYILIRTVEKRLRIAHQNVETQKESLKIAEARFKYGNVSQLDVEQAKTVLNNTLATIPVLETQLRQAKNALSVLLGLPPSVLADELAGATEIPVSPPQVVVGIPADLLRRRPDIRSAELRAAAQCAQIGVAKADLYPAFSLSGTFGFLSSDVGKFNLSDMFQWKSRTAQAGPSVQWNILNYGRITNNVRVQDARLEQLMITYQNAVLKAQQEVEDALVAFLRAQERAEFLAQSVTAAKRSLDLAVLQYREGTKDFTTVLIAQQALLTEQDNLASTLGNISGNLVGVYRALGGGWEIREGKDLVPPDIKEAMAKRTHWGKLLGPASYNPPDSEKPKSVIRLPDW
jgi:NodT family efflux transporter outer membrane factor (OMF) lipoprotein